MYGQGNTTSQPQGYTNTSKPQQIQMQKYSNEPRHQNEPAKYTDPKNHQAQSNRYDNEPAKQQPPSISNYVLQWVVFISALILNVGVWVIDNYATGTIQASYYYYNAFKVSSAMDIVSYTDSTYIFAGNSTGTNSPIAVAMSLVFSWILWKLSLIVFCYHIISREEGKGLRIGTALALLISLLGIDIVLTIFALNFYNDYVFYGAFTVLAVIVSLVNCKEKGPAMRNLLIPLLLIAGIYFIYGWLLPTFYTAYVKNLSTYSAIFLIFYGYPIIDTIIYSLTLFLGCKTDDWVKGFFSTIQFLLIGYGVGMILLIGYTQVEFYYLIAYFIFRNIFVNYVMRRWEKVVSNPAALPGWGICYYVSYGLSYLPIIGVGSITISKSFSSYLFARTSTLLYPTANPLYPYSSAPTAVLGPNISFNGSIFWLAGLIIWIALTFSQRYPKSRPTIYDLFYYLFGIHLFYLGISCSLSLYPLYTYSTLF